MRPTVLSFAATLSVCFAILAPAAEAGEIMVMKAFARASATPVAKSAAAYVSLMNHGAEADRLVSAASPAARSAEVHKTELVDGVMKMMAAGPLELPAYGTLEMKPGGYHLMLMGLKQPLKEGEILELTLTFEKAGALEVKVPVGSVAEGGHDHGSEGMESSEGSGG
ncbi:copper chaperone PCu(A)C [Aestuariivirga sp.]|uniref:copper chaperone PCu(A)C n=1 Tax=Aestuariivirga sp. TaxID=2650926 RepID=UPI00391B6ACA